MKLINEYTKVEAALSKKNIAEGGTVYITQQRIREDALELSSQVYAECHTD
jgi:hypothetical protein